LKKDDFFSVLEKMRLKNGLVWTIPIILDISEKDKNNIEKNNINIVLLKDNT
jgi:ATP sulfurylase